jgi:hypothetical protein
MPGHFRGLVMSLNVYGREGFLSRASRRMGAYGFPYFPLHPASAPGRGYVFSRELEGGTLGFTTLSLCVRVPAKCRASWTRN